MGETSNLPCRPPPLRHHLGTCFSPWQPLLSPDRPSFKLSTVTRTPVGSSSGPPDRLFSFAGIAFHRCSQEHRRTRATKAAPREYARFLSRFRVYSARASPCTGARVLLARRVHDFRDPFRWRMNPGNILDGLYRRGVQPRPYTDERIAELICTVMSSLSWQLRRGGDIRR